MSVPYVRPQVGSMTRQENFGDKFWYIVYFQKPGVAKAELEADVRKSIRTIHYSLSGDPPEHIWLQPNAPASAKLLGGLIDPPTLPRGSPPRTSTTTSSNSRRAASGDRSIGIATWIAMSKSLLNSKVQRSSRPPSSSRAKKMWCLPSGAADCSPRWSLTFPDCGARSSSMERGIGYRWSVLPR